MAQQSTTTYVVELVGSSNAYNALGILGYYDGTGRTARERRDDACQKATAEHSIYRDQYLKATPWSRCSAEVRQYAQEANWETEQRLAFESATYA